MIAKEIETLKNNCSMTFFPPKFTAGDSRKHILCVVPNLSMNGAQTVLLELLELLKLFQNYELCIISPEDGEYRDIYVDKGALVCIRPYISVSEEMRSLLQTGFDAVILNTALVHGYSMFFVNTPVPVLWWIHESKEHLQACCIDMPNPNLFSSNFLIYGVTETVTDTYETLYGYTLPILHMSISDCRDRYPSSSRNDGKVQFVMPGAYTPIKGQDLLLQAIISLPPQYREKAVFVFCGFKTEGSDDYYNRIMELSKGIDCVVHAGKLNKDEMYRMYADSDCVIAPSRVDPTPTTIVEGMMFEKITLASVNCGITKYMTDCVNGFVFADNDELVKRLMLIISDIDSLRSIREKGRLIWKDYFSPESVLDVLEQSSFLKELGK